MQVKVLVIKHYVNHSLQWISFVQIKVSPWTLKFGTVDIKVPCPLETYHPIYIRVALKVIKTIFHYGSEYCFYTGFQTPTVRVTPVVICTEEVVFKGRTPFSWLARSLVRF